MSDETPTPTKPGYKTTEFYLTMAAMILSALYASGAFADTTTTGKVMALIAGVLGSLGYTVSRAIVKKAA